MEMKETNKIMKASLYSILWNLALCAFKLVAGVTAHSAAMVSDAVHSASDVFSTVIVMIGVKISNKEADENHPYGHERMECIAAMILSAVLIATGLGIGYAGVQSIHTHSYESSQAPGLLAVAAAIVSIAVKEGMFQYAMHVAKQEKSTALRADAWHHRSDAMSSIGALIGILFARFGFPVMDPIASIVICVFVLKAGVDIFKEAMNQVVDHTAGKPMEIQMREQILSHREVQGISTLKTRLFGSKVYLDVEIEVDPDYTLRKAHEVAEEVHDMIEAQFPEVKHCMVHVNPAKNS